MNATRPEEELNGIAVSAIVIVGSGNVLKGNSKSSEAKTMVSHGIKHTTSRLHQMMFDGRDYERADDDALDENKRPNVNVVNWHDKDYSVVTIQCKDRPKLLFDTVCTLTDMQYVVFHASINAEGPEAYQVCHPLLLVQIGVSF